MIENELSAVIVNACSRCTPNLGPGLLESVCEEILIMSVRKPRSSFTSLLSGECRSQFLINFNEALIKDGIYRVVNGL